MQKGKSPFYYLKMRNVNKNEVDINSTSFSFIDQFVNPKITAP